MMEQGSGRSFVRLEWSYAGDDLLVNITGGERAHVGAAAIARMEHGAVEVRVIPLPGHKEEALARACAEDLCRETGRTVLVSCGIHIDHAAPAEIDVLCGHVRQLEQRLLNLLRAE